MSHKPQHGNHTWNLYLKYHQCPHCSFINESRKGYEYKNGRYEKQIRCNRCKKEFTETKPLKTIGPIMGEPPKPEFNWGES